MRLHTQIILLIGAVAMGIGLISSTLVSRMLHSTLETELRDQAVVATQSLAEHITDNVINGEVIEAREALRNMVERSQSIQYAYIIDFDGRLFAHSFEGGFPKALAAAPRQYYAVSAQSPKMIHLKTNTGFVLEIGYPLIESMRAHVRIGMSEAHTQAQIAFLRNRIIGLSLLLALISITIGVFVSRGMTQPLAEMVGFMRDFGMRKREEKIDFRGGGKEIAALTRAFNWMISERKRAEEALRESEEKYRLIFETAANLITSVDSDGTLMDCNNRIEEVLGYKRAEMIGQNMGKIIHPDYHQKAQESLAELITTGTAHNKEYKMVRKDGRLIDVSVNSSSITDGQGNFIRSICIIDDITERKQARVFLQTVIDGIPDSMLVINRDYTIALANQTVYKMAGGQDPIATRMKCHQILHNSATPCTGTEDICPLEQVIATKAPVTVEHIHYDAKGHTTTVEITAAPIFDKEGEVIQIIESCRDIAERKQAERALKESEEKFRKILASSPDAIMLFDAESRQFLEVNEAAVQLYGYSREEFLKLKHPQITDEIEASDSSIKDLLSGRLSKILLRYHKKKDGTVFPVEISGSTFSFKDRKVMCGIIRDITERKQAEYALKESEERFKGIYSQSPVGIEIYDLDGKLIDVNQVCLDIFGVESVEEVKGFRLFEDPNLPDNEKELLKKGEEVQYESEFNFELVKEKSLYKTSKSGRMFIDCLITPVKAYDGSPNGYLVHVRDITERKRAERAIKESEAQFRFLFENSLVGVGIADASGKVLFCNETMERILGFSKEELSKLNVADTYKNPEDQKRLLEILQREGQVLNYEVELICKTNKPFWVSLSTKAVKFRGSEARLTTCIDITERKQAETTLHKHVLEQNILLKVSQSVSSTLDLEVVLQTIGDGVTQMLDIETAAIYLLEEEDLFLGATTPPLDPQMPEALRRAKLADHPHLLESVSTGLPVILPDIKLAKLSPAEKDIVEIRKLRSLLFLPFKQEENVIGVLILGTISQPREFSDHEIDLCQTITNQLALGVQNARLHTGLKKYTKELEDQITERKRAEGKVKFLSQVTEQVTDSIIATDLNYKITYANRAFQKLYGYSKKEIIGQSPDILNAGPNVKGVQAEIYRTVSNGREWRGEVENRRKDGSIFPCELTVYPLMDDNGNIFAYTGSQRDITERKRAEEEIKSLAKFPSENPDPVLRVDFNGVLLYANETVFAVLSDWELRVGQAVPGVLQALTQRAEGLHVRKADIICGERIFSMTATLFPDAGYVNVYANDITERNRAEENLRESEKKFKRITERIYDVILAANLEGDITYVSPSVIRVFGHSPEELVGKNIIEFVPKAEIAHVLETFKLNAAGEEVEGHHSEFLMKDGSFARIELNAVPIIEDGKIVGAQAIIRNVTETKRLQELESRAERLETAGTIAGQVAHDFNNLLAPIMAYPEFIHDELPHDNQAHAFLDAIESAAKKIADINQDLLTMGRRGHYTQDVINLNRIVLQAVQGMELQPGMVTCITDLCEDLMSIKGGDAQIHRMLLNLMVNAQDAMENIGQITVKTENYYADDTSVAFGRVPKGEYVKITVSDNGCGIPDDIIEKILDPFFTTKTADRKRGSGLGLSVVDAVVKDHNGYLDLSSKVGHGTSFYLYFPVTREDAGIDEFEHLAGGTDTILIVDDDETQREVVLKLLKKLGYRVTSVESGERAIEFLVENPQDLVVLDMIMPGGIDGAETYRRILGNNPHQKAILLSGFSESDRVLEAQRLGAGAFVRKPVTKNVIAAAVRTELDRQMEVVTS